MPRVEALWQLCAARSVVPGLLVVPDWHGRARIEDAAPFVAWVRDRAADGAEIFLHGERHDEAGLPRQWRDEIRAFGRTNREGEFLTLGYTPARDRIDRGLERLRTLGLDPIGFVPPAWLCTRATHDAARDAGLAVSEDDGSVHLLGAGVTIASPVVRWSGRGAVRAYGSVIMERARWVAQRRAPVVRIALHPGDLEHPATTRSLERALDAWLSVRVAGRYAQLAGQDSGRGGGIVPSGVGGALS
jgi:predicted deacetylase